MPTSCRRADFLRRTVPALVADSGLAFVQARWGHANRGANWLTRVQGLLLDAHFAVEQEARFRAGMPLSFNGSAGVWNRTAIEQGGGWTGDTLTEDLDLSMRCMMQGWRGAMVSDLVVPGELPQTAAAWRAQQARWTKGHAQVRAQAAAHHLGQHHAALEKSGDDAADVPVLLLHAGLHQRRDLADPDVYGRGLLSRRHLVRASGAPRWALFPPSAISISASACWAVSVKPS